MPSLIELPKCFVLNDQTEILCFVLRECAGVAKTKLLAETRPLLKDVRIQY